MDEYEVCAYLSIGVVVFIVLVFLTSKLDAQDGIEMDWKINALLLFACVIAWPLIALLFTIDPVRAKPKQ